MSSVLAKKDRFFHLKSIDVVFPGMRPESKLEIKLEADSVKHKSPEFQLTTFLHWECEVYIESSAKPLLTVRRKQRLIWRSSDVLARFHLDFESVGFTDDISIELKDETSGATAKILLGDAKSSLDVTHLLAGEAVMTLATKMNMLENFDRVLGCLKFAIDRGRDAAQFYPPLQPVLTILTGAFERLQKIPDCHHELTRIMDDAVSVLPSIELAFEHAEIVEVEQPIIDYFNIVRDLSERIMEDFSLSNSRFLFQNLYKSKGRDVSGLQRRMATLKDNIHIALSAHIQQGVSEIHHHLLLEADKKALKEDEEILEQLKPPEHSSYDLDRCCLPGTRESVIREVVQWSQADTPSRLFWLYGVAGCGKSSVVTSVALMLDELNSQHFLSYSFFCKRDDPERRNPIRVIRALAYYLARAFEPYRTVVIRKLKEKPSPLNNMLHNEFKSLLVDSIKEIAGSAPPRPVIIILDSLDECDENETVSKLLVNLLDSASWIKLVVTSRPLSAIQQRLESSGTLLYPYDLFKTSAEADILVYLNRQFQDCGKLAILRKYVTPADIHELARKALGLFIWITVVCSYINQHKSGRLNRFQEILQSRNASNSEQQLDKLYREVLDHAVGPDATGANKADIRLIAGVILATSRNRPLPADALFVFGSPQYCGLPEEWQGMLQDLRSVFITDPRTNAIRVCHKSFLDFLGSRERSGEFWTEPLEIEMMMAKKCFSIMLTPSGLKFNICELETSYLPNEDVNDLSVDQYIPRELQYSCLYWLDHLSKCETDFTSHNSIRQMLRELFCQVKSLYWLEVLSLLYELKEAAIILEGLMNLLRVWDNKDEIYTHVNDLYRFVKAFHEPMAMSTPHIYISALLWVPSESVLAKSIGLTFTSRACLLDGRSRLWPTNVQTILLHSEVRCVAYSPDGRRIVSGSRDGAIQVWDAETGAPVGEPSRGHDGSVSSVKYSPDGRRIVSGSDDYTIRIWEAETGAPVGGPLRGHDRSISSVTYSPDGRRIVSGSVDRTIRVWDAVTGAPIGEPLRGHNRSVSSVNCSPDGRRIVSGSRDGTIQIWDIETGAPAGEPLRGHSGWVSSVEYSPDGRRIVSGSVDRTVRIWDAECGVSIGEPLRGHDSSVSSVAYSPSGHRIVSGSVDRTVRIWDAESRASIGEPLRGHDGSISCVNYSPDAHRIVSGSDDRTMRIWDAELVTPVGELLRGHDGWVCSVDYSPAGRHIVSGSHDGSIRIWDAETGAPVREPLRGHNGSIWSVRYSPDGRRIVSGSNDGIIRIWDEETGAPVGEPLRAHDGWVYSVDCSPDGRRIVSGSDDCTIRVWNLETGAPVGEPLRGHDGWIHSVSFSPDGRRIVSGSDDCTIRVWDTETGVPVGVPLRGHDGSVSSVNYSPDGRHIVSGSVDRTLRVWDAETGASVGEPFRGHIDSVRFVRYSPDGRYIVSGSDDCTIRIWDVKTGALVGEPLRGHDGSVSSVIYSPEGQRIVSGSDDRTIRVWDAEPGTSLSGPLRRREDVIPPELITDKEATNAPEAHSNALFDTSSWVEGQWKYCLDEECFISKCSEALAQGMGPAVRSRTPQQVPPDGWIRTVNDGLLLWIPPEYRHGVCDMSLFCVPRNTIGRPVRIDWKKLHYDTAWSVVKIGD